MKKRIYTLIIGSLVAGMLMGCEEEDRIYRGPVYYEFSAAECGQVNYRNILQKETMVKGDDRICVQLIKPSDVPVQVNYRVADQVFYIKNKSSYVFDYPEGLKPGEYEYYRTTAVYGEDYLIGGNYDPQYGNGSVTIPADEVFGYIPVEMLRKSGTDVYIVLEDGPDAQANRPTALLNWKQAVNKVFYLQESFASVIPDTWTLIDKDGDGYCWNIYDGAATSDSYLSAAGALLPENYLISPELAFEVDAEHIKMTFELASYSSKYYKEKYRVIISTLPITADNCRDAIIVQDYTELTEDHAAGYVMEEIDLSAWIGKTVYIGFVHGNSTDNYSIMLRNVNVYSY